MIDNYRVVTVYNADKKEVVGIFSMASLAARYLYNVKKNSSCQTIINCINRKSKVNNTIFDFKVVVRNATPDQKIILGNESYVIFNGYQKPMESKMQGFSSTKESLMISSIEKLNRKNLELKRNATN